MCSTSCIILLWTPGLSSAQVANPCLAISSSELPVRRAICSPQINRLKLPIASAHLQGKKRRSGSIKGLVNSKHGEDIPTRNYPYRNVFYVGINTLEPMDVHPSLSLPFWARRCWPIYEPTIITIYTENSWVLTHTRILWESGTHHFVESPGVVGLQILQHASAIQVGHGWHGSWGYPFCHKMCHFLLAKKMLRAQCFQTSAQGTSWAYSTDRIQLSVASAEKEVRIAPPWVRKWSAAIPSHLQTTAEISDEAYSLGTLI